jgi:hypothetical protein
LRGTFVVGADRKVSEPSAPKPSGRPLLESLLKLAALPAMARNLRATAADAATRTGLAAGAGVAGAISLLCLSYALLTLLAREMDPAAAWAIVGGLYALAGAVLYLAATRRRRS